jgi:hypothetical protein
MAWAGAPITSNDWRTPEAVLAFIACAGMWAFPLLGVLVMPSLGLEPPCPSLYP